MVYQKVRAFTDDRIKTHARELAKAIYEITGSEAMRRDYGLCDQMRRAAVSIMSNIAEGHERGTTQEYYRFLSIAKGSCAEVRSQLYLAFDLGYIDRPTFQEQLASAESTARLIGALRAAIARHLASSRNPS